MVVDQAIRKSSIEVVSQNGVAVGAEVIIGSEASGTVPVDVRYPDAVEHDGPNTLLDPIFIIRSKTSRIGA